MIRIRTKMEPNRVKTYASRREIQDLLAWGMVLEILDDEAPVVANDEGSVFPEPEDDADETGEEELVVTQEQVELHNDTFSDFPFEEEQE